MGNCFYLKLGTQMRGVSVVFAAMLSFFMIPVTASAQIDKNGGPVSIDARHVEVIDEKRLGIWTGEVRAVQGDSKLNADRVKVFFLENPAGDGWGDIARIEAEGDVRYITPTERARGNDAVYDIVTDTITFRGDVAVTFGDREGVITGDELYIEVGKRRSTMRQDSSGNGQNKRVRAVIMVPKKDEN